MVQATVKLKSNGPASWSARGYRLTKGASINITNPADIRYFQSVPKCLVSIVRGEMPKAPPVEEPDEDEDDDVDLGDPGDPDAPADGLYSEADLKKQTKQELVNIGESDFGLQLNANDKKDDLVKAIMAAHEESADDDSDADGGAEE